MDKTTRSGAVEDRPSLTQLLFEPNISINGLINGDTVAFFLGRLQEFRQADQDMILELNTDGGDADAARRIALEIRLYRSQTGHRALCVGKSYI